MSAIQVIAVRSWIIVLLIPLILAFYRPAIGSSKYFWGMLGFYVLSKIMEFLDAPIFAAGGAISGHSLKHLFAAAATAMVLLGLMRRRMPAAPN